MNDKDEPMKNIQGFKLGVDLQSQNHPFSSNYFYKDHIYNYQLNSYFPENSLPYS